MLGVCLSLLLVDAWYVSIPNAGQCSDVSIPIAG